MANPQGTEFLSIPLTNFSVAQMQAQTNFVARSILPSIPVDQQGAPYYVYPRGEWLRDDAQVLGRGEESAGGGWTLSDDTYFAKVYAFHKDNDDQDYKNASATRVINLDQDATDYVTRKIQLQTDNKFASTFMPSSGSPWDVNFTGDASPSAGEFLFWDDADATPVDDVSNEIVAATVRTGGFKPNWLILPPRVFTTLRNHPTITGRFQYTRPIITEQMLADIFGIDNVKVAWAVINKGKEGLADDLDFIFGDNVLLGYFGSTAGPKQETAGALFSWTDMDGASSLGTRIDRYRIPQIHSMRIEGFAAYDMKVVDSSAATLFIDTLST